MHEGIKCAVGFLAPLPAFAGGWLGLLCLVCLWVSIAGFAGCWLVFLLAPYMNMQISYHKTAFRNIDVTVI